MEHHSHIDDAIRAIDKTLEEPPITIEQALKAAVKAERMTEDEAIDCLEAYQRSFLKSKEVYGE